MEIPLMNYLFKGMSLYCVYKDGLELLAQALA